MRRVAVISVAGLMAMALQLMPAMGQSVSEFPLHAAAAEGNVAAIRGLLSQGAAVDARDRNGRTALLVATHANHIAAAQALIEAGADVNAKDDIEDSPYLYAGARGHLEILRITLAHGADLRSTNRYGGTALIPAAERGHVETVRTLLEAIILGDGGQCHQQIVQLLVDAGARVDLADRDGVTPRAHALSRDYAEIERILVAAGAEGRKP
ncbi:ankyrin repeat domain-containing protein [Chelatococcus sp. GW1]|uniref:Ankyrin repeat domain-containing protein n=1 Tax=Chelatococcus caeni TaxID=1348468 RepID=A0A840C2N2_9HYPH|nr:hypothetical protein [Chelatococcus caeni]